MRISPAASHRYVLSRARILSVRIDRVMVQFWISDHKSCGWSMCAAAFGHTIGCLTSFALAHEHTSKPECALRILHDPSLLSPGSRQRDGAGRVNLACPLTKSQKIDGPLTCTFPPQDFLSLIPLPLLLLVPLFLLARIAEDQRTSTTAPTASNPVGLPTSVRAEVATPGPTSTANAPRTATTSRAMRCRSDTVSVATLSRCVACGWSKTKCYVVLLRLGREIGSWG